MRVWEYTILNLERSNFKLLLKTIVLRSKNIQISACQVSDNIMRTPLVTRDPKA